MTSMSPDTLTPDTKTPVDLEAGDICVAATYAVGEPDIRRNMGDGRVLVYTKNMELKGALWTSETGLVIGVEYCKHSNVLFVSDLISQTVKRFSMQGELLPSFADQQGKPLSTMEFTEDGSMIAGEHVKGDRPPFMGGGEIYSFSPDGKQLAHYPVDRDKGKFGFHAVTNLCLVDDGNRAIYLSETGKRIMQYDLGAGKQLGDLLAFDDDNDKFTAGLSLTKDGNLLISHVYGVDLYDLSGKLLKEYTGIPRDRGWAAVWACQDGKSFLVGNFFTGRIEKRCLTSGDLLGEITTNLVYKLSEICEIG